MTKESIKSNLTELCCEIFRELNVDSDIIKYGDFVDELGMNSIMFITLIVEIEALFEIVVPDDLLDVDCFRSINDIVDIIDTELTNKRGDRQ